MKMTRKDWVGVAIVAVIISLLLICSFAYINEQAKKPEWLEFARPQLQEAREQLSFSAEIIADPIAETFFEEENGTRKEKKAASERQTVNVFLIALQYQENMPKHAFVSLHGREFEFNSCSVHKQACLVYRVKNGNWDLAERELKELGVEQGNIADFFIRQ